MSSPLSTVLVVPRERFGSAIESLESLLESTSGPFSLVYVDAGSPPAIARGLADLARRHDFTLIRYDGYLSPNQARNVGLPHVATRYVAFADNDVFFECGWLAALERCAEETAADVVAPLTCIGQPLHSRIHHAGGSTAFLEGSGKRLFKEYADHGGERAAEVRGRLVRRRSGTCEFHCALLRTDSLRRFGGLDENFMTSFDHTDLSLMVHQGGGRIMFEPGAMVTYVPKRVPLRELPFFMLRWNGEWTRHTVDRFMTKWNAAESRTDYHELEFVSLHRGRAVPRLRDGLRAALGWRVGSAVLELVECGLAAIGRRRFPGLGRKIAARVVHAGAHDRVRTAVAPAAGE